VAGAVTEACRLEVGLCTLHAAGGAAMLEAAAQAAARFGPKRTKLLAVTVLTSHASSVETVVSHARVAQQAGCDGVVCAVSEAAAVREACGIGFWIVTPGIRLQSLGQDDQRRVARPAQALAAGADQIVVGRPIYLADEPLQVVQLIESDLGD
jgi:orotidine-5'-phosphate decarboxylase